MGRRWTTVGRFAGLYYRLHPDHHAWQPPTPTDQLPGIEGAGVARLDDGRSLVVFVGAGASVVLEGSGLDDSTLTDLARAVQVQSGG